MDNAKIAYNFPPLRSRQTLKIESILELELVGGFTAWGHISFAYFKGQMKLETGKESNVVRPFLCVYPRMGFLVLCS